jgi:hypothetical protein
MVIDTSKNGSVCSSYSRGGLIQLMLGILIGLVFDQWTPVLITGLVLILLIIIWIGIKLIIERWSELTIYSFGQLNQEEI